MIDDQQHEGRGRAFALNAAVECLPRLVSDLDRSSLLIEEAVRRFSAELAAKVRSSLLVCRYFDLADEAEARGHALELAALEERLPDVCIAVLAEDAVARALGKIAPVGTRLLQIGIRAITALREDLPPEVRHEFDARRNIRLTLQDESEEP